METLADQLTRQTRLADLYRPLDRNRVLLGILALAVFLLTFTLIPIEGS